MPGGFQTLIGTVKRRGGGPEGRGPGPVSNPHRYGQKADKVDGGGVPRLGFQTLIGTVKRPDTGAGAIRDQEGFQTLIGTVKRWRPVSERGGFRCFKPS